MFLGPTEAQLMDLAWERESLTVKQALFLLGESDGRAYTTIMTVLNRLAEKGLLSRRKAGRGFIYAAAKSREEFIGERVRIVREVLRKNFAGDA
ncbi:MAG TPA: BlaI/MecI/CopY family transcriptional regulator [candidate division Zixibacteria bacterium]|nr:BlaI/MecI/CopY family transcriptional regulator [candidate division Zixibacteria bacterium]MDD4916251.1 BlaI/MecI/CopY family transcriptional regulator [candidate division Zixibacteria bacterium]MDM7973151.1 BlaI/MecI/CopY family transcriptional regulator [candidate division Zixibacteria bacterium]HOD67523.1 BlaI/MecI/CopY family transcriptional regulator [candidate division Zixibacteria bacterium]HPI32301.1 BlaI/MecI/CopY family transcriptional regulator [candidate division Zixibacteria bac